MRQTDTEKDRHRKRQTQRKTDKEKNRHRERKTQRNYEEHFITWKAFQE